MVVSLQIIEGIRKLLKECYRRQKSIYGITIPFGDVDGCLLGNWNKNHNTRANE